MKLHMMMTINSLCLTTITEFMDEMLDLRETYGVRAPIISLNILRFPSFQSAAILPEEIKSHYKEKIDKWIKSERPQAMLDEGEKESVIRLIDYLDIVKTPHKNTAETPKLYNDFKAFFAQYDIRRNKDFASTFPGPLGDWFTSLEAEVPSESDIRSKTISLVSLDRAGDPANTEAYGKGDDAHESVGGWDTEKDALGGVNVDE